MVILGSIFTKYFFSTNFEQNIFCRKSIFYKFFADTPFGNIYGEIMSGHNGPCAARLVFDLNYWNEFPFKRNISI